MTLPNLGNFNFKQKIVYITIASLALFLLIMYMIILPTVEDIKTLRADIIDQKIDLEKKLSKEKNISILIDKLETIEPQIDKLKSIYINKNRELEFITTLEGIADLHKVSQKIVLSPDNATKEMNYQKIPLSINTEGTYQNLIGYLKELESVGYYINILTLKITNSGGASSRNQRGETNRNNNLILQISADTFWK